MLALREETKRLTTSPAPGFALQTAITEADNVLLESAAPTNGVAVAVLKQCTLGMAATQEDMSRVRNRLALVKNGLNTVVAGISKKFLSLENSAARCSRRPSSWRLQRLAYPQVITVAKHAKANATRAEAEAARPGEG
jgi:hypothetical protein